MWYIYMIKYYLAINKNKVLIMLHNLRILKTYVHEANHKWQHIL